MNVAPLFSVLYIVGYYLLLYGRTNNVVKRRAALCFAACQSKKVLPAWFASVDADIRIGRRRHPHRSAQMLVSVGADICIGRRRHPHRSAQMLFPMIANHRWVWHPCHTHAATPHAATYTQPPPRSHIISRLRGECVSKLQNRGGGLTVGGYGILAVAIANSRNDLYFCC